jgi:hypothetical protein
MGTVGWEHTSRWLSRVLEGKVRSLVEFIEHIRDSATTAFIKCCWTEKPECKHIFLVAAFQGGTPWIAAITNSQPEDWRTSRPPMDHFVVSDAFPVETPKILMLGIREAVQSQRDKVLLRRARDVRPRHLDEYLRLLATINRRAASSPMPAQICNGISSACETTWLPPPPAKFVKWLFFWGKLAPTEVQAFRHVVLGVNTLPATRGFVRRIPQVDPMKGVRIEYRDVVERAWWRQMLHDARGQRTAVARAIIHDEVPVFAGVRI